MIPFLAWSWGSAIGHFNPTSTPNAIFPDFFALCYKWNLAKIDFSRFTQEPIDNK